MSACSGPVIREIGGGDEEGRLWGKVGSLSELMIPTQCVTALALSKKLDTTAENSEGDWYRVQDFALRIIPWLDVCVNTGLIYFSAARLNVMFSISPVP